MKAPREFAAADSYFSPDIEPGNPKNWPRQAARSNADLGTAIANLLKHVDDANIEFALTEFIRERLSPAQSDPHTADTSPIAPD